MAAIEQDSYPITPARFGDAKWLATVDAYVAAGDYDHNIAVERKKYWEQILPTERGQNHESIFVARLDAGGAVGYLALNMGENGQPLVAISPYYEDKGIDAQLRDKARLLSQNLDTEPPSESIMVA